jgi:cell division septation protein DedD
LKTRVRVGPFASRAEAEKLHERLALLGENAMVVRQ